MSVRPYIPGMDAKFLRMLLLTVVIVPCKKLSENSTHSFGENEHSSPKSPKKNMHMTTTIRRPYLKIALAAGCATQSPRTSR